MDALSTIDEQEHRESEETSSPLDTCLRREVQNDSSDVDSRAKTDD